jgi:hypothetical protein
MPGISPPSSLDETEEALCAKLSPVMLPEEKHVLSVLKTTMRVLGYSNRDLERQLKLSGSYLSRVFSGDLDLRYSHILLLSRAMGLAPEEILRLLYPPEPGPRSPAAERLRVFLESRRSSESRTAPEPTLQESEMREAIERVLSGIVEGLGPVALFSGIAASPAAPEEVPPPAPLPLPPRRRRPGKKKAPAGAGALSSK